MDESDAPEAQLRVLPSLIAPQEEPVIWTNEMQAQLDSLRSTRKRATEQLKKRLGVYISLSTLNGDPDLVDDLMIHADKIRLLLKPLDPTAPSEHMVPPEPEDVHWIVTSEGDVGVSIYGRTYVCYKGESLCVTDVMIRPVEKRELGESLKAPELQRTLNALNPKDWMDPDQVKTWSAEWDSALWTWFSKTKEWQYIANPSSRPPKDTPALTPNPVNI